MASEAEREAIAAALRALGDALPEATTAYLFGSTAAGDSGPSSDLDLAVLASDPIAPDRLMRARERLAELAHRDVDLIDLTRVPTVMQAQIVSTGRVLRDADPAQRETFETRVYSAYARLNEERREILERIQREGRIHGR
jgi:predicted nucleotidyltransferase